MASWHGMVAAAVHDGRNENALFQVLASDFTAVTSASMPASMHEHVSSFFFLCISPHDPIVIPTNTIDL